MGRKKPCGCWAVQINSFLYYKILLAIRINVVWSHPRLYNKNISNQADRRGAEFPYSIYPDGLSGRFYSSESGRLRLIPALASETTKPCKSRNTVRKHRCYCGKSGLVTRLLASHPYLWVEGITTPQTPETAIVSHGFSNDHPTD